MEYCSFPSFSFSFTSSSFSSPVIPGSMSSSSSSSSFWFWNNIGGGRAAQREVREQTLRLRLSQNTKHWASSFGLVTAPTFHLPPCYQCNLFIDDHNCNLTWFHSFLGDTICCFFFFFQECYRRVKSAKSRRNRPFLLNYMFSFWFDLSLCSCQKVLVTNRTNANLSLNEQFQGILHPKVGSLNASINSSIKKKYLLCLTIIITCLDIFCFCFV